MRLSLLLLVSHTAAVFSCVFSLGMLDVSRRSDLFWMLIPALMVCVISFGLAKTIRSALGELEGTTTGRDVYPSRTSIVEIDNTASRLQRHMQRWAVAARCSREQTTHVEELLSMFGQNAACRVDRPGERLHEIVSGISDGTRAYVRETGNYLEKISQIFSDLNAATSEQKAAVREATEQIAGSAEGISNLAEQLGLIEEKGQLNQRSLSTVNQNHNGLTAHLLDVRESVNKHEVRLRSLVDGLREIGAIADSIGQISSKTDMLALNVSIESARAGEHGRRFAAVADEVRSLSEHAASASREVTGLSESLLLETQQLVSTVGKTRSELSEVLSKSAAVQQSIGTIEEASSVVTNLSAETHCSVDQQLAFAKSLVETIGRVSASAQQSDTSTRKLFRCTESMGALQQQVELLFDSIWNSDQQPIARSTSTCDDTLISSREQQNLEHEFNA